jgi:hypothetical protein
MYFCRMFVRTINQSNGKVSILIVENIREGDKRSSCELLERDFGINIPLEKIYRMMDRLTSGRIKQLQDKCWNHTRELFGEEIKIMFYDCTTLYFESFTEYVVPSKPSEEALKIYEAMNMKRNVVPFKLTAER